MTQGGAYAVLRTGCGRNRAGCGGYRGCDFRIRPTETKRETLYGAVPVPQRKNTFVLGEPGETDLLLFRMPGRRRRVFVPHGVPAPRVHPGARALGRTGRHRTGAPE